MPFWRLTRVGTRNHVLDEVKIPRKGEILGIELGAIEKHWESLLRCTKQKDHSVLNNGTTCDATFCHILWPLVLFDICKRSRNGCCVIAYRIFLATTANHILPNFNRCPDKLSWKIIREINHFITAPWRNANGVRNYRIKDNISSVIQMAQNHKSFISRFETEIIKWYCKHRT